MLGTTCVIYKDPVTLIKLHDLDRRAILASVSIIILPRASHCHMKDVVLS